MLQFCRGGRLTDIAYTSPDVHRILQEGDFQQRSFIIIASTDHCPLPGQ